MILHVASFWKQDLFRSRNHEVQKLELDSWSSDEVTLKVILAFPCQHSKHWCPSIRVFPKIGVPQNGWWKSWKTLLKWMIWGYYHFWKHPSLHNIKQTPKNTPQNAFPNDTPRPSWILGQSFLQSMWPSTQRNDHFGNHHPPNDLSSWWLNQPIWKICSSKWVRLPQFKGENKKYLKPPTIYILSKTALSKRKHLERCKVSYFFRQLYP